MKEANKMKPRKVEISGRKRNRHKSTK